MNWLDVLSGAIEQALGPQAIIYCLAAIGLNIHFGYTGLLNFGQSAFMAMAAYGLAVTVATYDLPMWLGIIVGLGLSVLLALLLGEGAHAAVEAGHLDPPLFVLELRDDVGEGVDGIGGHAAVHA